LHAKGKACEQYSVLAHTRAGAGFTPRVEELMLSYNLPISVATCAMPEKAQHILSVSFGLSEVPAPFAFFFLLLFILGMRSLVA